MRRALELAERGRGLTSPNPMVGAVVARNGEIVGEGFHARAGGPHAEIVALEAAGGVPSGTVASTCSVAGSTTWTVPDPAGATHCPPMKNASVRIPPTLESLGQWSAHAQLPAREPPTANPMRERRPHVTLKAGMTADGKIADVHGTARWITGEAARAEAHRQRSEVDAIVAGVTTVLRDDPALTVRLGRPWPREPWRVVLDTDARTPVRAQVIAAATPSRALIAVGETAPAAPSWSGSRSATAASRSTPCWLRCSSGRFAPCSSRAAARSTRRSSRRAWWIA